MTKTYKNRILRAGSAEVKITEETAAAADDDDVITITTLADEQVRQSQRLEHTKITDSYGQHSQTNRKVAA
jgi:hypothetical protein